MSKKSYAELLKDPRWQKKRLEVLNSHDWSCQKCQSKTKTLEVHHGFYESRRLPWEYPDASLFCLCEDCHELFHSALNSAKHLMGHMSFEQLSFVLWILIAWNDKKSYPNMQSAVLGFCSLMGQWIHHGRALDIFTDWWHNSYGNDLESTNG